MKIFTNRGFEEEMERRREVRDEREYVRRRLYELEEKIEHLYNLVHDLQYSECRAESENHETN